MCTYSQLRTHRGYTAAITLRRHIQRGDYSQRTRCAALSAASCNRQSSWRPASRCSRTSGRADKPAESDILKCLGHCIHHAARCNPLELTWPSPAARPRLLQSRAPTPYSVHTQMVTLVGDTFIKHRHCCTLAHCCTHKVGLRIIDTGAMGPQTRPMALVERVTNPPFSRVMCRVVVSMYF